MKELLKSLKRESGKWHDILPIAIVWSVLVGWIVFFIGYTPLETGLLSLMPYSEETLEFMEFYFSFVKVWFVLIPIFLIRYNRPMLGRLALTKAGKTIPVALVGFLLGFGTNAICILFSVIFGDIKLTYSGFDPDILLLFFVVIAIQCGAEELIDRLYLYQKLRRRYKFPVVAILGSTAAFVLNHLFAPGFSIIPAVLLAVCGVILALLVYYYDCFWAAVMFHTAWNFSQSIVFGLPNSGEISYYSIFTLDTETARDGFFYDSVFGVEGSIGAILVLVIVAVVIILLNRGKGEKNDIWA